MSHSSLRIAIICMLQPGRESSAETHSECAAVEEKARQKSTLWVLQIVYCDLCPGIWGFVNTGRGIEGQGEGTVQECALSLQCGLQLSEKHSPKETAGGIALLAATAVAHNYPPLSRSLSSLSTQPQKREQHKPYCTLKAIDILYHVS